MPISLENNNKQENIESIKELKTQIRKLENSREEALSSQTRLALDIQSLKIEKESLSSKMESKNRTLYTNM